MGKSNKKTFFPGFFVENITSALSTSGSISCTSQTGSGEQPQLLSVSVTAKRKEPFQRGTKTDSKCILLELGSMDVRDVRVRSLNVPVPYEIIS